MTQIFNKIIYRSPPLGEYPKLRLPEDHPARRTRKRPTNTSILVFRASLAGSNSEISGLAPPSPPLLLKPPNPTLLHELETKTTEKREPSCRLSPKLFSSLPLYKNSFSSCGTSSYIPCTFAGIRLLPVRSPAPPSITFGFSTPGV